MAKSFRNLRARMAPEAQASAAKKARVLTDTSRATTTSLPADIALLRACVRQRFMDQDSSAIVLALEGFKWLLGEETGVAREGLEEEKKSYE